MTPFRGLSARRLAGWMLFAVAGAVAPLAGSGTAPGRPAWGQTLVLTPGAYQIDVVHSTINCAGSPDMVPVRGQLVPVCWGDPQNAKDSGYPKDPFFVLAGSGGSNRLEYQWEKWNGQFEIYNSWITNVCGYEAMVGGRVLGKDRFYIVDDWGYALHKLILKQAPAARRRAAAGSQPCKETRAGNVLASRALPGMVGLGPSPLEGQRRTFTGQFLIGLRNSSTARDEQLWKCLFIDGNYPGIHFVDAGGRADDWAFVWPSALFRVTLTGGATYAWRLAPPIRCGILRAQSYRGEFQVPRMPGPTEERLLLGCLVADEGFANCRSWWLHRP